MTEGELWIRRELEALKARRFSAPAIATFLARSQRRAGDVRAQRPELAAQSRRWIAVGALASARQPRPRAALAWWAACAVMLDWHLGMLEDDDGTPRPLGPADAVTLARAWAVPLVHHDPSPALVLAAWASDGLDGALARRGTPTRAGRDLEGLVDLCFAIGALRGLLARGALGRPAASAEITRLVAGLTYAVLVYFGRIGTPDPAVTKAARASTPLRVAGLVAAAGGHRRVGTALVVAGSAWAVATTAVPAVTSLRDDRRCRSAAAGRRRSASRVGSR